MSDRRTRHPSPADSEAARERRAQRDRAYAAYYRMAADTMERQHQATANGALPTRLSTPWPTSLLNGFGPGGTIIPSDFWGFEAERDRARALEDENWLACSVLDRSVENVIGTGITIEPTTISESFNDQARTLWERRISGTGFDARGTFTFAELQRQAYRAKLRDGDVGTLLAEEIRLDGTSDPKLQIIEPDWITAVDQRFPANGVQIVSGVEMNQSGKPIAFHIQTASGTTPTRIEERDMIFLHRALRYGDVRGRTAFRGGWVLFDMIMGYLESVVVAARIGASQAMIAKRKNPQSAIASLASQVNANTGKRERLMPIQPGMINMIDLDEELTAFNPAQPQQSFPEAIAAFARFVGLKFGLTLEQVLLDFSRTTYSSSRQARIQAEATASVEQEDFAVKWVGRVYRWFISKCVKAGLITGQIPDEFWSHEWIPQGRPWVDPTKEIDAAAKAVALGIDARTFIAMSHGYKFKKLVAQNQADNKLLADAGLSTNTGAGQSPFSGQPIQDLNVNTNP